MSRRDPRADSRLLSRSDSRSDSGSLSRSDSEARSRSLTRRSALAALAAGLAGCLGPDDPEPDGSPTDTGTPTPTVSPGGTPNSPAGTPTESGRTPAGLDDESVRWRARLDGPVKQPPAVDGSTVHAVVGEVRIRTAARTPSTGSGAAVALDVEDGAERWRADLDAPPTAPPVARDGGLYVAVGASNGYSGIGQRLLRLEGGSVRWRSEGVDQFLSPLAFDDERAYLGTGDDAIDAAGQPLLAVGLDDGKTEWTAESGDARRGRLRDDLLLVDAGGLAAIGHDAATGDERWRTDGRLLADRSGTVPVVDGAAFVAAPADSGRPFAAIDLADGSERWSYSEGDGERFVATGAAAVGGGGTREENGEGDGSTAEGGADVAVVGTEYGGRVFALDADGSERWTFDAAGDAWGGPVVADGTVHVGVSRDGGGVVRALDLADGSERWRASVERHVDALVPAGDELIVASHGRKYAVRALAAEDGAERWAFRTSARLTEPAVADGTAYVGSDRGAVLALGE